MNKRSNILIQSVILLFLIVFLFLVYQPLTQGHFFDNDDYFRIWTSPKLEGLDQSYASYSRLMPAEGRPLNVLLNYLIFNEYINSLKSYEAANTIRIIGIIGIGLLAYVLYAIFKANRYRASHALLLSILICTLPPMQIYLGLLICIIHLYGMLLSALSFLVLFKVLFKEDGDSIKKSSVAIAIPVSMILFIASLCIYQPTALIYWALAIIPLLKMKDEDLLNKRWNKPFAIYFSAGVISMMLYFIVIKMGNQTMDIQIQKRSSLICEYFFSYDCAVSIYHRLIWFIKHPLSNALREVVGFVWTPETDL